MKLGKFLILLIIVIWLSSAITYAFFKGYYRETIVNEFDMDIIVIDYKFVGFNADTDKIYFGFVTLGGGSTRHINITNTKNHDVFIYFEKDDSELSSIVTIDPNYFILKSNENKEVDVRASVPKDFTPGNHTGKLKVIGRRAPLFRK